MRVLGHGVAYWALCGEPPKPKTISGGVRLRLLELSLTPARLHRLPVITGGLAVLQRRLSLARSWARSAGVTASGIVSARATKYQLSPNVVVQLQDVLIVGEADRGAQHDHEFVKGAPVSVQRRIVTFLHASPERASYGHSLCQTRDYSVPA